MTLFQRFSSRRRSGVLLWLPRFDGQSLGQTLGPAFCPVAAGPSARTRWPRAGRVYRVCVAGPGVRPRGGRASTRGWHGRGSGSREGLPGFLGRAPSVHRTSHVPGVRVTRVSAQNSERCPRCALNRDVSKPRPPVALWSEPCHPCPHGPCHGASCPSLRCPQEQRAGSCRGSGPHRVPVPARPLLQEAPGLHAGCRELPRPALRPPRLSSTCVPASSACFASLFHLPTRTQAPGGPRVPCPPVCSVQPAGHVATFSPASPSG